MTPHEDLFALAKRLKKAESAADREDFDKPISALEDAAQEIGRSFFRLLEGYHCRVYHTGFSSPPGTRRWRGGTSSAPFSVGL